MKLAVRANRCQVWLPDRLPEEFSELIRISRLQLSEGSGAPMGHRKSCWITEVIVQPLRVAYRGRPRKA
jgi:hypothetical protein